MRRMELTYTVRRPNKFSRKIKPPSRSLIGKQSKKLQLFPRMIVYLSGQAAQVPVFALKAFDVFLLQ
jgi:hypothetical protein